jgi:hypothetical protein
MEDDFSEDPYFAQVAEKYTPAEINELQRYLAEWATGTYSSALQSVVDHAERKGFDLLKYLRRAHNFNKRGAIRKPRTGYRQDGSVIYRKGDQFLILRPDQYGIEKIVSYGTEEE